MLLLCCDTSTPLEAVAIVRVSPAPVATGLAGSEILAEHGVERGKGHGATLLDAIDGVLAAASVPLQALDGLVCGLGPGGFTGLRVSLATLKGLALALDKPLYGVRSVEAFRHARPGEPVVFLADARRGEVFADGFGLPEPVSATPEKLAVHLGEAGRVVLVGHGAWMYADRLRAALPHALVPPEPEAHRLRAALLARAVTAHAPPPPLATLEPCYVRASDAELNYPQGFPDATTAPKQALPPKRRP